jgi:hypothetical protein
MNVTEYTYHGFQEVRAHLRHQQKQLISPSTVKPSRQVYGPQRGWDIRDKASPLSIDTPIPRQLTQISAENPWSSASSIHEEQPELDKPWESILSSPVLRCESPHASWECDGFLCNYSANVPRVVGPLLLVAHQHGTLDDIFS